MSDLDKALMALIKDAMNNDQAFKKGDIVLVRAHMMGTHVGTVDSHKIGGKINLGENRKLWRWCPKKGLALDSLAKYGVDPTRTCATAINGFTSINDNDCCGIIRISREIYDEIMALDVSEQE